MFLLLLKKPMVLTRSRTVVGRPPTMRDGRAPAPLCDSAQANSTPALPTSEAILIQQKARAGAAMLPKRKRTIRDGPSSGRVVEDAGGEQRRPSHDAAPCRPRDARRRPQHFRARARNASTPTERSCDRRVSGEVPMGVLESGRQVTVESKNARRRSATPGVPHPLHLADTIPKHTIPEPLHERVGQPKSARSGAVGVSLGGVVARDARRDRYDGEADAAAHATRAVASGYDTQESQLPPRGSEGGQRKRPGSEGGQRKGARRGGVGAAGGRVTTSLRGERVKGGVSSKASEGRGGLS